MADSSGRQPLAVAPAAARPRQEAGSTLTRPWQSDRKSLLRPASSYPSYSAGHPGPSATSRLHQSRQDIIRCGGQPNRWVPPSFFALSLLSSSFFVCGYYSGRPSLAKNSKAGPSQDGQVGLMPLSLSFGPCNKINIFFYSFLSRVSPFFLFFLIYSQQQKQPPPYCPEAPVTRHFLPL